MSGDGLLLDVTRPVWRSWSGRLHTGIDRVCQAYLSRFADRARAVIQHRGVVRVADRAQSQALFALLMGPDAQFRAGLARLAPQILAGSAAAPVGSTYLNIGHTDFDLPGHARWLVRHALRPVYLIHDLIPITHAEHCRLRAVRRHRGRVEGALRHGAGILVSSAAVAAELERFAAALKVRSPPVLTVPLAGAALAGGMTVDARAATGEGWGNAAGFFLCVGTIESRKNHALLIDVWERLCARLGDAAPGLVIAGGWGSGSQQVRRTLRDKPLLRRHVHVMEDCPDHRLAGLMAGARAVLLPSLAEGFGLPLVEALAAGVPVIASDLPCFREIGEGIPTLIDPRDADRWEALISRFDADHPEHRRQIARLRSYRARNWNDHFERLEGWLRLLPPRDDRATSPPAPARRSERSPPRAALSAAMGSAAALPERPPSPALRPPASSSEAPGHRAA